MQSSRRPGPLRVLLLGGSSEATALARVLSGRDDVAAFLSLAGRTMAPAVQPLPLRVGGFGGVEGLVAYLRSEHIDVLVDATHPFAAQITCHAREAAARAGCRLVTVRRPQWMPEPGDRWTEVPAMADVPAVLGDIAKRVFLTVGRLQLAVFSGAPQHRYLVRTIDPVGADHGLGEATFVEARGPFAESDEIRLMRNHRIEVLVTKNSGGSASRAKLGAARELAIPVILVRPPDGRADCLGVADALEAILSHVAPVHRGV